MSADGKKHQFGGYLFRHTDLQHHPSESLIIALLNAQ